MSATILPFPHVSIRAIVVIPSGAPGEDRCRAVSGGWPIDAHITELAGPLYLVRRKLLEHEHRNGLPITIHPECYRRAGWPQVAA